MSLTTEFRLEGPGPGLPGTRIFDADELEQLLVRPFAWELVEPLDLACSPRTRATELRLADLIGGVGPQFPHVVLREGELLFTSVHLALRKA